MPPGSLSQQPGGDTGRWEAVAGAWPGGQVQGRHVQQAGDGQAGPQHAFWRQLDGKRAGSIAEEEGPSADMEQRGIRKDHGKGEN